MARKTKKKWAADVEIREGALRRLGWPDISKVVAATNADNRRTIVSRLNYLANVSTDKATVAKAKTAIRRIQKKLGKS